MSRAVSRVDSRTRETRVRRELMRTEQGYTYALKNTGRRQRPRRLPMGRSHRHLPDLQVPGPVAAGVPDPRPGRVLPVANPARGGHGRGPAAGLGRGVQARGRSDIDDPRQADGSWPRPTGQRTCRRHRTRRSAVAPDRSVVEVGKEWEPSNPLGRTRCRNPPTATKEVPIPIYAELRGPLETHEGGSAIPCSATVLGDLDDRTGAPAVARWGYRSNFVHRVGRKRRAGALLGGRDVLSTAGTTAAHQRRRSWSCSPPPREHRRRRLGVRVAAVPRAIATPQTVQVDPAARDEVKVAVTHLRAGPVQRSPCWPSGVLTKEASNAGRLTVYDIVCTTPGRPGKRDYDASLMRNVFGSAAADAGSSPAQRADDPRRAQSVRPSRGCSPRPPFKGRPGRISQTDQEKKDDYFPDVHFDYGSSPTRP